MAGFFGGAGDDFLFGDPNSRDPREGFWGGKGDDVIHGYGGLNRYHMGDGDDWAIGGSGRDEMFGGEGNDVMAGGGGVNIYWPFGRPGNGSLGKSGDVDVIRFGSGREIAYLTDAPENTTVVLRNVEVQQDHIITDNLFAFDVDAWRWVSYGNDFRLKWAVFEDGATTIKAHFARPDRSDLFGNDVLVMDDVPGINERSWNPGYSFADEANHWSPFFL